MPLSTNQVSFWAFQDSATSIEVSYLASDSTWKPYVNLAVPAGSLSERPDGSAFAAGDSILITLTLDTMVAEFDLQPDGLQFSSATPAVLKVYYGGLNPDFSGDGLVTWIDRLIEQLFLNLYTRPTPSDPWQFLPSVQSLVFKRFTAQLEHFCGYALDW
jgi:hypothetical protein